MINELRTFLAVVHYQSFARAGDHIGLSQSAVSGHIKRLEDHLGLCLFDRSGRRALLSPAGQEIHQRAQDIVTAFGQLGNLATTNETQGTMTIGAITSAQQSWLMQALASFRGKFPGMSVCVLPGASLSILGQIDAGDIDLAVMVQPPFLPPPEVQWTTLVREPYTVIVPADYAGNHWRLALEELPFIRYDRVSFGGRALDLFLQREQLTVDDALEFDEVSSLIQAVEEGIGAALVPITAAYLPYSEKVRVLPVPEGSLFREIGIAQRTVCRYPEITSQLVQLIRYYALRRVN